MLKNLFKLSVKAVEKRRNASQKDSYFGKFAISGQACIVRAQYNGPNVEGHVSCGCSVKNFTFKFLSLTTRRTQNIYEELKRLYLDTEKNQQGKYKVRLFIEEESIWPLEIVTNENINRIRYLAQLKGTGLRHVSIILKRSDDRS